jgi:2,4-dienoyl-CoA reductase-like NADH-dependent reductase (Old Yellow Enzyme family)
MGCQLWHAGTVRNPHESPHPEIPNFSISTEEGSSGTAATEEDIQDVADAYVRTAKFAVEVGFDALEIHCAHGYLLDLFLWDKTNSRRDMWGGSSPIERARFPLEICKQIRAAVGHDIPIFARFSQWKRQDFAAMLWRDPDELGSVMEAFAASGVDIFDCSLRRFWQPEFDGSDLNLAGWVKKLVGKPTVAVGSVGLTGDFMTAFLNEGAGVSNIDALRWRLERSEFDLIAVGRALMNDPLWLDKVRTGRLTELNPMPENAMDIYW